MKKIFAVLLSAMLLLTSVIAVSAYTDETALDVTCVASQTEVKMGDEFSITVSISGYEPIQQGGVEVAFNANLFELITDTKSGCRWLITPPADDPTSFYGTPMDPDPTGLTASFVFFNDPQDINGDIYELVFRAKADAKIGGDAEITVKPTLQDSEGENFPTKEVKVPVNVYCTSHSYGELIPEVPAKCGETGKRAHYECAVCHRLFDDKQAETTEQALVIPALSHVTEEGWHSDTENHWKECVNGCGTIMEGKSGHSFTWTVDKPATEDDTGLQHEECSVCGFRRSKDTEIPKLDHKHIGITQHDAVPANCHATGSAKYWTCASEKCGGKYYGDAECSFELETITEAINPNNHDGATEIRDAKDATCAQDGYTGDIWCLGCNKIKETGKLIPATDDHKDVDGKWENDSSAHWHTCECGKILDKADHTGGEATCIHKAVCEVCGSEYGDLVADNHKNTELRNEKVATEEAEGYTGDTWCNDCDKQIATGAAIPRLEHIYGDAYQSDAENHWKECENGCGTIAEQAAHTFGEWAITKDATATEKGIREKACTVCGYKVTEEIPVPDNEATPGTSEPNKNDSSSAAPDKTDSNSTTSEKSDTTDSEIKSTNTEKSPQTGDQTNLALWILLFSCSCIAAFFIVKKRHTADE